VKPGTRSVEIREEAAGDADAIDAVHLSVFGGAFEGALVRRLHADGLAVLSLVAIEHDIVGHLLLSRLDVEVDGQPVRALALAPVAVMPAHQRLGIGSALIGRALGLALARSWQAVIVVGHPDYYSRFGFSAALARKLASPYAGDSFMALELALGALRGTAGRVTYPPAFDDGAE
jgi:putative acetyltransferase